jgi:hypothetical protein
MMCVKSIWRTGSLLFAALVGWLAIHGTALAQKGVGEPPPTPGGSSSYVLPYTIVILFVGLGMFFVCRPVHRRDRARPEEYVSVIDDGTMNKE